MKVVFVCTGNVCRSPMGELLLPHYMPDLEADSAGTRGLDAHEIAPNSAKLLAAHGIDAKQFRSKRITPQLANSSGLILCFEHEQRKEIAVIAPTAARRTFLSSSTTSPTCARIAKNRGIWMAIRARNDSNPLSIMPA